MQNKLGANYSASPRPAPIVQEPVQAEATEPTMEAFLPAVGREIVLDSGDVIRRPERGVIEYEHLCWVLGKRKIKNHRYTVAVWMGRDARKMATVQRVVAASMGSRSSLLARISLLARETPDQGKVAEYVFALKEAKVCSKEHAQGLGLLWYLADWQKLSRSAWGGGKFSLADREKVARILARLEELLCLVGEGYKTKAHQPAKADLLAGLNKIASMGA